MVTWEEWRDQARDACVLGGGVGEEDHHRNIDLLPNMPRNPVSLSNTSRIVRCMEETRVKRKKRNYLNETTSCKLENGKNIGNVGGQRYGTGSSTLGSVTSVWATISICYGVCMEEHTCKANSPHINGML